MGIFLTLFKASMKKQTQYKTDFIMSIVMSALILVSDFIVLFFLLSGFNNIEGWNIYEIALIYSIVEFGHGVYRFFANGLNIFQNLIISGRFDGLLIRPISTLTQVIFQQIEFKRIGFIIQALGVGIFRIINLNLSINQILLYVFLLLLAPIITLEISIIIASTAFWMTKNDDLVVLAYYSTKTAAVYPASIYDKFFQYVLTFAIPLATVGYYPVLYLTGKSENILNIFAPIIAILVFGPLSLLIWNLGLKKYTSTGT